MHRFFLPVASILAGLLVAGCLPVTSSSPLGSTVAAAPDPALTGLWKGKLGTSTDTAYLTFYPEHDGVGKIVVLAPPTARDEGGWMVFAAHSVILGGNHYLDAREIDDGGKPPDPRLAHMPVLYRISADGSLALYLIDEKAARAAIEKGALAGTVEPGEYGDVTITAGPAALDTFFASAAGRALFMKPIGILQRVN